MENVTWTLLHAQLHRTLKVRQLLPPQHRFLIAVSGGQDSLCLVKLLLDLQPKWDWDMAIAHCDHRWRTDSAANAQHIAHLAALWHLPYYQKTASEPLKSEATARDWRYQVFSEIALDFNYPTLVTGHTQSDRAETLLHNLLRGTGADGLQSLPWRRMLNSQITLVRPLLEMTRSQTALFCQQFQLPVWEDSTNQDLKYTRNRIRHCLIPQLQEFNPQVERHLSQTAELLQADVAYLEQMATQLRQQVQHPTQPGLNRLLLKNAPLALQRRVIRQFLATALPHFPRFEQIEKVRALLDAAPGCQTDPFPGGMIACVDRVWIWLQG